MATVEMPIVSRAATSVAFRTDAVAEMTKQRRTDGACHERDGKRGQRSQNARGRVGRREKQPWEHQDGSRGVDIEVEELDGRTNQAREKDLAGCVYASDSGLPTSGFRTSGSKVRVHRGQAYQRYVQQPGTGSPQPL
jgi:hypothetical protein